MGMRQTQSQARLDHQHPASKTAMPGDPRVAGQIIGSPEMLELPDLPSLGLPMCVQPFVMLFFMNNSQACHSDHRCVKEVSLPQHVKTKGSPNQKSGEQGHIHEYEDTCLAPQGHPHLKLSLIYIHSTCSHSLSATPLLEAIPYL